MALSNIAELIRGSTNTATSASNAQAVATNPERNGLSIGFDSATATERLFIKLGTTAATTTNWDCVLAPDQSSPGLTGQVIWQGAVQVVSATTTGRYSVTEV